ncbi:hypothetical protein N7456_013475 [Penicillium angulare]|uniref:Alpha-acetolactate decarboxylase n=1 Tax=Penicillium angulare TaxID=116970 RepID=A0A9W9EG60_9EURO|nr:hypothetical protein N7456_013475 [Penicillium angulare]
MSKNELYQYSVISALMEGICETGIPVKDALENGDHGLGTVPRMEGEIVIIDGEVYHFPPNKLPQRVELSSILPFVMTTRFKPTFEKIIPSLTMKSLPEVMSPLLPSQQNQFLSIRVYGHFSQITFRVAGGQCKPRERLVELAKRQQVFALEQIEGTLFGFWSPAFSGSFSVPGFHLHFLSKDKKGGGHVLDFDARSATLQAAAVCKYMVELPQSKDFNLAAIKNANSEELKAAEGGNNTSVEASSS